MRAMDNGESPNLSFVYNSTCIIIDLSIFAHIYVCVSNKAQ